MLIMTFQISNFMKYWEIKQHVSISLKGETFQWSKNLRNLSMKKNILRKHNLPSTQNQNLGILGHFFYFKFWKEL